RAGRRHRPTRRAQGQLAGVPCPVGPGAARAGAVAARTLEAAAHLSRSIMMESFAIRLRDVLSTLEAAALLGSSSVRVRGLGEQLMFACAALPCEEALVALELGQLGRLSVPGVARADAWR